MSEDDGYLVESERPSMQESRLVRRNDRVYRTVQRPRSRLPRRERYPRLKRETTIEQLLGRLIADHGLTAAMRERCVMVFWPEIAGTRIAERTLPTAIVDGVLKLSAKTSVQVHELQFYKARLVEQINAWIFANQVWLGAAPIVSEIRVTIGPVRSTDPSVARQLQRQLRRLHPRPEVTESDRVEILAATSTVEDLELRAMIERVRFDWNR